jgi:hypothetical protein
MSVIPKIPRASGGQSPLGPIPGFCPGPAGDLKRSTDPPPTHAPPPNHKSWIRPWSCLCGILTLRSHDFWEMTNSKTRVRFVYVLPEVLHGDFLSEIKYLFKLEGNILQILTRNVIFFYDYSNWGELSFNIFKFFM